MYETKAIDWKNNGVRVIPGDSLDPNTPQTPGTTRAPLSTMLASAPRKSGSGPRESIRMPEPGFVSEIF
jgi:hypothetical protein